MGIKSWFRSVLDQHPWLAYEDTDGRLSQGVVVTGLLDGDGNVVPGTDGGGGGGGSISSVKSQTISIDLPDNGWATPSKFELSEAGAITRTTLRGPSGSNVAEVDIMVFIAEDPLPGAFDPDTVPQERRILVREGIAIVGSDVSADDDFFLKVGSAPADFYLPEGYALYGAIKVTSATNAQPGFSWTLTSSGVV